MLQRLPEKSYAAVMLNQYAAELQARCDAGKMKQVTVRLSLTPAIALLERALSEGNDLPVQSELKELLSKKPGQSAAITGFINFLNREHQATLRMPERDSLRNRRERAERRLVELVNGVWGDDELNEWIRYSLDYFHGVSTHVRYFSKEFLLENKDCGVFLLINNKEYFIPIPDHGRRLLLA